MACMVEHVPATAAGMPSVWRARLTDAAFEGSVMRIAGYEEAGGSLRPEVVLAPLMVPLVMNFAAPWRIGLGGPPRPTDRYGSFAAGPFPGRVVIASEGASACIQIDFTPIGASRFFRMPVRELTGRMVDLDSLEDRALVELRSRLGELPSWPARLSLVTEVVANRLRAAAPVDRAMVGAWHRLERTQGTERIATIANHIDISRRQLTNLFARHVGVPPKTAARMLRFGRLLRRAEQAARPDWSGLALDGGYADQAHMVREFVEFSGVTPTTWHRSRSG